MSRPESNKALLPQPQRPCVSSISRRPRHCHDCQTPVPTICNVPTLKTKEAIEARLSLIFLKWESQPQKYQGTLPVTLDDEQPHEGGKSCLWAVEKAIQVPASPVSMEPMWCWIGGTYSALTSSLSHLLVLDSLCWVLGLTRNLNKVTSHSIKCMP